MTNVRDYAIEVILAEEGGFNNNPADPGGATNMGITLNELSAYRGATCTVDDVRNLSKDEATAIYKACYWDKVYGDDLKPSVALLLFDAAVNHGVGTAIRLAQRTLHIQDDGILGPQTLASLNRMDPHTFIEEYMAERALYYVMLEQFSTFGRGWLTRLFTSRKL